MIDDVLNDNPLFSLFLSSPHYAVAASHSLLVAVPPAASLHGLSPRLSASLVDSHVLRSSPYFVGQYLTVNGRSVGLTDGRTLHCLAGGGWGRDEEGRISRVVASETYYDDSFHSFTVLRVDMPLEGRVSADYELLVRSEGSGSGLVHLLPRRSLSEHEALLQRLTGDGGVLQSVQRFVQQFNSSYVLVRGFLEHAGQKVADACSRLSQEALSKAAQRAKDAGSLRRQVAEVSAAVECAVLSGIHAKLFGGLVELHAADELRLQAAVRRMRKASMAQLGIRDDIQCQPQAACQLMAALSTQRTPLQKMAQLEEVSRAITQAVRDATDEQQQQQATTAPQPLHRDGDDDKQRGPADGAGDQSDDGGSLTESDPSSPPRKRDLVLSAEDMIPLTVYVLTHSRLQHIAAHLAHCQYFPPSSASQCVDQLAVHWVNFQAACQLVEAGKLSSYGRLDEDDEEGKQAVHPVSASTASSLLASSADGMDGLTVSSSVARVSRRVVQHSRSVSSSILSTLHSAVRRSPSSSPTPPLNRSSSLPTVDDGSAANIRPPDLLRTATASTASVTATVTSSSASSDSSVVLRLARLQRRHATLPTQRRRSRSPATATIQPPLHPHSAQQQPHHLPAASNSSSSSSRSLAASASNGSRSSLSSAPWPPSSSEDDRLGHFLSRLKRSEDVVTGNLTSQP